MLHVHRLLDQSLLHFVNIKILRLRLRQDENICLESSLVSSLIYNTLAYKPKQATTTGSDGSVIIVTDKKSKSPVMI